MPLSLTALRRGLVIPACPLALTSQRRLDERRQRALARYYFAAGAGGLAVGVHTTQFAIRDPKHGLFEPVLKLAIEEIERAKGGSSVWSPGFSRPGMASEEIQRAKGGAAIARIAGLCGKTKQALAEA